MARPLPGGWLEPGGITLGSGVMLAAVVAAAAAAVDMANPAVVLLVYFVTAARGVVGASGRIVGVGPPSCGVVVLLDVADVKTCTAVVAAGAGARVGWWHSLHMAYGKTNCTIIR